MVNHHSEPTHSKSVEFPLQEYFGIKWPNLVQFVESITNFIHFLPTFHQWYLRVCLQLHIGNYPSLRLFLTLIFTRRIYSHWTSLSPTLLSRFHITSTIYNTAYWNNDCKSWTSALGKFLRKKDGSLINHFLSDILYEFFVPFSCIFLVELMSGH